MINTDEFNDIEKRISHVVTAFDIRECCRRSQHYTLLRWTLPSNI